MTAVEQTEATPERAFPVWIITVVCAALLVGHLWVRYSHATMKDGLDAIVLGLAVVGLSPWIATIFKTLKFGGMEIQFQEVKAKVAAQGAEIDEIKFLIANFLSRWELLHLTKLAGSEPYIIDLDKVSPQFEGELRHLRAVGLIEHEPTVTIGSFLHDNPRSKDLKQYFRLTDTGRQYLKLRDDNLKRPPTRA